MTKIIIENVCAVKLVATSSTLSRIYPRNTRKYTYIRVRARKTRPPVHFVINVYVRIILRCIVYVVKFICAEKSYSTSVLDNM